MMIVIAIATVVTVFCLTSSKALLSQASYQRQVLKATHDITTQLQNNTKTANTLITQYKAVFQGDGPTNIIGGKNTKEPTARPPDGDNARIVINALPTTYDFPALLTSVSSILSSANIQSPSIGGTDESSLADNQPKASPQPTTITINVGGTGTYASVQKLIKDFERSIRPFDVTNLTLSGGDSSLQVTMNMNTYFQPAKALTIDSKEIK